MQVTHAMTNMWSPGVCMSSKLGWQGGCSVVGAQPSFKRAAAVPRFPAGAKGMDSGVFGRLDLGGSTRLPLPRIQVDAISFKGSRSVKIPVKEGAFPAVDYLRQLERVVNVTFPDSARISYLGDSVWRSRLRPITFFTLSATPVCDVQVTNKGDALQIRSDRLLLDLSGLPSDFINRSVRFRLRGQLQVEATVGSSYKAGRDVDFTGVVGLGLMTNLPPPLNIIPEQLVTAVGDRILDAILGSMEGALRNGIAPDYHAWCQLELQQKKTMESSSAVVGVAKSP